MSYQEPPAGGANPSSGQQPGAEPASPPPGPPPGYPTQGYPTPGYPTQEYPTQGYPPPYPPPYPPSYQQPPVPPQAPPPGPPPGAYPGYPAYGATAPRARTPFSSVPFDAATVGLGLLTLVFSHFAFYRIPVARRVAFNLDAYHGFLGWAGVWLVFLGAVAMVVPLLSRRDVSGLRVVALCAATLGLVFLILTAWVRPDFGYCDGFVHCDNPVKVGASYWVDLVLAVGVVGLLGLTLAKERELF